MPLCYVENKIATIACGIFGLKLFIYFIFCMKTINVHLLIINAILYFVAPIVCLLLLPLLFVCAAHSSQHTHNKFIFSLNLFQYLFTKLSSIVSRFFVVAESFY